MTSLARWIVLSIGWAAFALAVACPTVALLVQALLEWTPPTDGFTFSTRQGLLLAKTVGLAGMAAALALLIAIPAAYVVGNMGRPARRPWFSAMLAAPLLFPPTVYVFGWQRLLPPAFPGWLICTCVWALWAYPVPALVIGTGWARLGRAAYESALMEASPFAAFRRAVLPLLSRHVTLAALVLFVLFVGDYGVPHACGLAVYGTELLGWAANSTRLLDVAWLSLPCAILVLTGLIAVAAVWRRCAAAEAEQPQLAAVAAASPVPALAAALVFILAIPVPISALLLRLGSRLPLLAALDAYGRELVGSLAVAAATGLLALAIGLSISTSTRLRWMALLWMLVFGTLPGALIGEALLSTYRPVTFIYDAWPIVVLGYVARFGWVGVLTVWLAVRSAAREWVWQARTDGADEFNLLLRIRAAASWPTILFGASLVSAFAIAEIPTSSLVQVPSLGLISQILMEKFHKAEDAMLISLSLWLVLAALPAAAIGLLVFRSHGGAWLVSRSRTA